MKPLRQRESNVRHEVEWPARWILRFLEAVLPNDWRDPFIGDLLEEWSTDIMPNLGRARRHAWLLRQALLSAMASVPIHVRKAQLLTKVLLITALVLGGFFAFVDSRPTWDDTGVLAFGILTGCALLGALGPARPWRWALAVGSWIPLHDFSANRGYSSLLALGFAFAGAYFGAIVRRKFIYVSSPPANGSNMARS